MCKNIGHKPLLGRCIVPSTLITTCSGRARVPLTIKCFCDYSSSFSSSDTSLSHAYRPRVQGRDSLIIERCVTKECTEGKTFSDPNKLTPSLWWLCIPTCRRWCWTRWPGAWTESTKEDFWLVELLTMKDPNVEQLKIAVAWNLVMFGQNQGLDMVLASNILEWLIQDFLDMVLFRFRFLFCLTFSSFLYPLAPILIAIILGNVSAKRVEITLKGD